MLFCSKLDLDLALTMGPFQNAYCRIQVKQYEVDHEACNVYQDLSVPVVCHDPS
jgi:hypothetical protein